MGVSHLPLPKRMLLQGGDVKGGLQLLLGGRGLLVSLLLDTVEEETRINKRREERDHPLPLHLLLLPQVIKEAGLLQNQLGEDTDKPILQRGEVISSRSSKKEERASLFSLLMELMVQWIKS